jgi:uroporphyrinogen III methyltransferase/synthase
MLNKQGKDARALSNLNVASIGKVTSAELSKHGIIPDIQSAKESSIGLIECFKERGINSQRIFIPRSNLGLPVLPEGLTKLGNMVTTAVIYTKSEPGELAIPHPDKYDIIVFSSPSGVDNFFKKVDFPLTTKNLLQGELKPVKGCSKKQ